MALSDPTLMQLVMTMTRLARTYRGMADHVSSAFGLSHAMVWPLVMIGRLGNGARQGEVAEAVGVEPPSLVRIIDQLVALGYVERRDDPRDGRAKTVHLTDSGREQFARTEAALNEFRRQLFVGIPDQDIEACMRVMAQLEAAVAARVAEQRQLHS